MTQQKKIERWLLSKLLKRNLGYDILNMLADKSEDISVAFYMYDDYEDLAEEIEVMIYNSQPYDTQNKD